MIATYTAPVLTRYTLTDMAYSLTVGLTSVLGRRPDNRVVAVAMAKCRLETGNGVFVYNGNLGNVKKPADEPGNYTCIRLNEVIKNKVEWFAPEGHLTGKNGVVDKEHSEVPPGHYQTRMNALAGPTDAGYFYIDFIAGRQRWAKAWAALLAGNPEQYSHWLKVGGYYTAPEEQYTKTVMSLFEPSLRFLNNEPHEEVFQPEKAEWHNQLLLNEFTAREYEALLDGPNLGGGRALLDYEAAEDEPTEPNA